MRAASGCINEVTCNDSSEPSYGWSALVDLKKGTGPVKELSDHQDIVICVFHVLGPRLEVTEVGAASGTEAALIDMIRRCRRPRSASR